MNLETIIKENKLVITTTNELFTVYASGEYTDDFWGPFIERCDEDELDNDMDESQEKENHIIACVNEKLISHDAFEGKIENETNLVVLVVLHVVATKFMSDDYCATEFIKIGDDMYSLSFPTPMEQQGYINMTDVMSEENKEAYDTIETYKEVIDELIC